MANFRYGIFVHEVPSDYQKDALDLFPSKHIEKVKHDKEGLRIYFTNYKIARECILRRTIRIQESRYTLCPLVTDLTLHGIRKYASEMDIKDKMAYYGRVIDVYPVEEITKENNFETRSLTDDYRVILEVPEVLIDFELIPLQLPDQTDHPFVISFFCRLCRENGHMQLQCFNSVDCCVSQHEEVFQNIRRTELQSSCSKNSFSENTNVRVRSSSNQKNDLQVYKGRTSIKMDPEKGQTKQICSNEKPNDSVSYNHDERKNIRTNACFNLESQNTDCDEKHLKEDFSSQISIQTDQSNRKCGLSYHKSKPPKLKHQSKSSEEDIWSRIIPPKFHPIQTKSLLLAVYKTKFLDIPQKVEWKLREILKWNCSRGYKYLKGNAGKFIKWLNRYLEDVSRMKTQKGHAEEERVYQRQNTNDDKIANIKEEKTSRGVFSLCPEIEKIVLKTPGVLDPVLMRNFLNQVRGRRKQMEIAAHFEKDFFALSNQLNEIEVSYYRYGTRGRREDRDIDYIRGLRNRLMQENTPKKERSSPSEQSRCKKSNNKMILSQKCNSKPPRHVNCDKSDETQASYLQIANGKYRKEFRKYSRRKNLPGREYPSGTPKYSTEVCTAKCSEKKFQSNFQINSSYDGNCFTRSSTEREYLNDFRRNDREGVPSVSQSKRMLDDKKTTRNGYDPKRNFETNFSFYGHQCTSNLNNGTNYDSDWSRRASNKQSNYILQNSTTTDLSPHKQNFHLGNRTTELLDINMQSSSAEELPGVTKNDLREIMVCVQRSNSNEELSEISKTDLRRILSCVKQFTE